MYLALLNFGWHQIHGAEARLCCSGGSRVAFDVVCVWCVTSGLLGNCRRMKGKNRPREARVRADGDVRSVQRRYKKNRDDAR